MKPDIRPALITDFHTHAFPDSLAERAMKQLTSESDEAIAYHDGRVSSLLASMDKAGIHRSVLCSIATRPEQFEKILQWSATIRSERIIPLLSIHPNDPDPPTRVRQVRAAGFKGIKLHPYYQDFVIDEPRVFPMYEELVRNRLLLVSHTGFDVAFERIRRADPQRIARVIQAFPGLRLVTTHLGSWEDWDEVERHLLGKPVYMEISFAYPRMSRDRLKSLLLRHPREYLLFGTDSPWQDQSETMQVVRQLKLGDDWERAFFVENAARLLDE